MRPSLSWGDSPENVQMIVMTGSGMTGHTFTGYQGISDGWYYTLLIARFLTVGLLAAYVVRDILDPERDVVRARGLDDPAGGVLDQAPDRFRMRLAWPARAGQLGLAG